MRRTGSAFDERILPTRPGAYWCSWPSAAAWNVRANTPGAPSASSLARNSPAALSVKVTARISSARKAPLVTWFAMRCVIVVVLPEPAPARMQTGPRTASTARCCSAFSSTFPPYAGRSDGLERQPNALAPTSSNLDDPTLPDGRRHRDRGSVRRALVGVRPLVRRRAARRRRHSPVRDIDQAPAVQRRYPDAHRRRRRSSRVASGGAFPSARRAVLARPPIRPPGRSERPSRRPRAPRRRQRNGDVARARRLGGLGAPSRSPLPEVLDAAD